MEYILKVGRYSRDIIFNCSNWNTTGEGAMLLVDGRLEAVSLFLNNQLPIFNGHYLEDFSNKNNRRVPREYCFIFYINDLATRKEVLKFYLDLNNGGVVHTQSELDRVKSLLEEEIYKGYNA